SPPRSPFSAATRPGSSPGRPCTCAEAPSQPARGRLRHGAQAARLGGHRGRRGAPRRGSPPLSGSAGAGTSQRDPGGGHRDRGRAPLQRRPAGGRGGGGGHLPDRSRRAPHLLGGPGNGGLYDLCGPAGSPLAAVDPPSALVAISPSVITLRWDFEWLKLAARLLEGRVG